MKTVILLALLFTSLSGQAAYERDPEDQELETLLRQGYERCHAGPNHEYGSCVDKAQKAVDERRAVILRDIWGDDAKGIPAWLDKHQGSIPLAREIWKTFTTQQAAMKGRRSREAIGRLYAPKELEHLDYSRASKSFNGKAVKKVPFKYVESVYVPGPPAPNLRTDHGQSPYYSMNLVVRGYIIVAGVHELKEFSMESSEIIEAVIEAVNTTTMATPPPVWMPTPEDGPRRRR